MVGRTGNLKTVFVIYLLGLLLGGLYVGMVSPVRLVIQAQFGLDDATGIWMINIYTLFYAACIPVVGKLADMRGRKPVFLGCLTTFAIGSLVCGLSQVANSFWVLLAGRLIQAVGACGVIPVANAEIGSTFPQEKKGMALGIAAGLRFDTVLFGGFVNGLIPCRAYCDPVGMADESRRRERAKDVRIVYGVASCARKQLLFTGFSTCNLQAAETMDVHIQSIKLRKGMRIVITQPSELANLLS